MPHIIIGTAGHIDHGKTALVRALTGVDTDRLQEEKQRGLTIDLGFAHWGEKATIIDVPGHERFVRNMVAGVSTIDLVLLVIAADDGVMPQTREHLDILKILQVQRGLIVLNKVDLVDEEWLALITEDVKALVKDSFLEEAEIVRVSSTAGTGIDSLSKKIDALANEVERNRDTGVFWMPVDRSFSMKGFGTVLTGSVLSGTVHVGDSIEILPQKVQTKVRGLQSAGRKVAELNAGDRAAVNLQSVNKSQVGRGSVLTLPSHFASSQRFHAKLQLLESAPRALKHRTRVRVHLGTTEVMARVAVFSQKQIDPGRSAYAQLELERPVSGRRLDPFVLRQYSPTITIGGGLILNADAPRRKLSDAQVIKELKALEQPDPSEVVESILLTAKFSVLTAANLATELAMDLNNVEKLLDKLVEESKVTRLRQGKKNTVVHRLRFDELADLALRSFADFHEQYPTKPGIRKAEIKNILAHSFDMQFMDVVLAKLKESALLKETAGYLSLQEHKITLPPELVALKEKIASLLYERAFATPSESEIAQTFGAKAHDVTQVLTAMTGLGEIVRADEGQYFHSKRMAEAQQYLISFLREHEEITISQFKDLLHGASRKYAMPLINYFDRIGVTERDGDVRILKIS